MRGLQISWPWDRTSIRHYLLKMNSSGVADGKIAEEYGSMGTKKLFAWVRIDCKQILPAQTCQAVANRKQRKHLNLKTEKIRASEERVFREYNLSNNNKKNYLEHRCCFYHLIPLRVWMWDERERAKRPVTPCPVTVDELDWDLGPIGLKCWNTGFLSMRGSYFTCTEGMCLPRG